MNRVAFSLVVSMVAMPAAFAGHTDSNPLSKAVALLDTLTVKVTAEREAAAKAYKNYEAWCFSQSTDLKIQIKGGEASKGLLQATIAKATADIAASDDKIEALAQSVSSDEQEQKEAAAVRGKETADFAASEAELVDTISTLDRAVMILQKQMHKHPAAFAQVDASNMKIFVKTLSTIVDAASFPVSDQTKLLAMVQSQTQQGDAADEEELGAPAPGASYKTHSSSISDVLEDLKERAEGQLMNLRKAEANSRHNYQMLAESLTGQIHADTKDLHSEKAAKAASQEARSIAEGDLVEGTKGLDEDKSALAVAGMTCMTAMEDHVSSTRSRNDQLTALATAKKILSETSSGAANQAYSFIELDHQSQTSSVLHSQADLANAEVVNLLKKLAKENHSDALAQLASRIAVTLRYGASAGQDPFTKVRQLIVDLLTKLQSEAQNDATEKSYCDEELAKTEAKKAELDAEMTKLSTKMDQVTSASAGLKADVKELQATLAQLERSQAEIDGIRMKSHEAYLQANGDLELGLQGIRQAISVLRDYYGGSDAASAALLQGGGELSAGLQKSAVTAEDAGGKVISSLEVVETDFARSLAVEETAEADAAADYQKTTNTNKQLKLEKESDVKHKTREFKALDMTSNDLAGDEGNTGAQVDAILEYSGKIKERCIARVGTYESRSARREAELDGLKEALSILEGEGAFVQRHKKNGLHRSAFLSAK